MLYTLSFFTASFLLTKEEEDDKVDIGAAFGAVFGADLGLPVDFLAVCAILNMY
jgi:hypothetical protein